MDGPSSTPSATARAGGRPRVTDPVAVEHDHPVADGLTTARNEQVSLDPVHAGPPLRRVPGGGAFVIMRQRVAARPWSPDVRRNVGQPGQLPGILYRYPVVLRRRRSVMRYTR